MAKTKKVKEEDDELVSSVYINPLTDFGFKKLFNNEDLLIAFLNDVIGTNIKEVRYLQSESLGEYQTERVAHFDLYCTTKDDEYFIVEMQFGRQLYFKDRVLFYAAHAIRQQGLRKKKWDFNLKGVYVVSILNFITFKEETAKDEIIERVYLYREKGKERYSNKLCFVFAELPKFKKQASELQNNTETWLFLLKNAFKLKACPPEITGEIFKRFLEIAELKKLTPTEMETYQRSLSESYELQEVAECERAEGRIEGEMAKSKQLAVKLLQRKMSIEDVVYLTELTQEQVQELMEED